MDLVKRKRKTGMFFRMLLIFTILLLITGCSMNSKELYTGSVVEAAIVQGLQYKIVLKNGELYLDTGKKIEKILEYEIIDMKVYDIDRDGEDEIAVIDSANENLILLEIAVTNSRLSVEEIYRMDFSEINPWMVEAGDVDGDGIVEIFIGVNKRTEFYEDVRNRPFFYSWNGDELQKKWTGSYFSEKELIDIKLADLFGSGRYETIALERNKEGKYSVSIYSWLGFGFIKTVSSREYESFGGIVIFEEADGKKYVEIEYMDGNIKKREEVNFVE